MPYNESVAGVFRGNVLEVRKFQYRYGGIRGVGHNDTGLVDAGEDLGADFAGVVVPHVGVLEEKGQSMLGASVGQREICVPLSRSIPPKREHPW